MKQNKSFTASKCLLYKDNFDGILTKKLKPPIEVNIDPINACNLKCTWCNAWRVLDGGIIPIKKLIALIEDLADWGVKGICFAGGGEPTLHPGLEEAINTCAKTGLESSIITNGFNWSDELIESMVKNMRWIGISIDCAKAKTYEKSKGIDGLDRTVKNVKKLVKKRNELGTKIGITFKMLIHPNNQYEVYDACMLAKEMGVDSIHLRPVDFLAYQKHEEKLDVKKIREQVERAKVFNDNTFEIVPFFVNFDKKFKRKITFDKCRLSPLLGVCLPTGWWLCIDQKGRKGRWMCDIEDIRKFWGSKEHFAMMKKINPPKHCGKCTLTKYYPYFESYEKDEYYWKFV
jgi:MoaA/NifB/PqqE/SkfB family radical SAM enzyme